MSAIGEALSNVEKGVLGDSTVTVETTVFPPFTVSLAPSESPSFLMKALKPRVTVNAAGVDVATYTPYGDPSEVRPFVMVAVLGIFGLLVLWVLR